MRVSVPISPQYSLHLDHSSQGPQEIGSRKINFTPIVNNVSLTRKMAYIPLLEYFVLVVSFLPAVVRLALPVESPDLPVTDIGTPIPIIKHKATSPRIRAFLRFISLHVFSTS